MRRFLISEEQAQYAIAHHEFPTDMVEAGKRVAVVCTQGWCPQWKAMEHYLGTMDSWEGTDEELTLFVLVYDQVSYFDEFRSFKETIWRNFQVPYVRYYIDGILVGESNYVPKKRFLATFENGTAEAGS